MQRSVGYQAGVLIRANPYDYTDRDPKGHEQTAGDRVRDQQSHKRSSCADEIAEVLEPTGFAHFLRSCTLFLGDYHS